jgi:hypothetical protein
MPHINKTDFRTHSHRSIHSMLFDEGNTMGRAFSTAGRNKKVHKMSTKNCFARSQLKGPVIERNVILKCFDEIYSLQLKTASLNCLGIDQSLINCNMGK